jgi:hypothetical protein
MIKIVLLESVTVKFRLLKNVELCEMVTVMSVKVGQYVGNPPHRPISGVFSQLGSPVTDNSHVYEAV